jgi:DNA-binding NarL/FixJ family response regulator
MSEKVRIVIAEDHTILREGLRSLLSSNANFEVVGEAGDGREAIRQVKKLKPDLILSDLSMPRMNGMEAIKEIKRESPATKILVLTVHRAEEYILATFRAGADGYLLKDSTHSELLMAVKKVLSGTRYISPEISEKVIEGYIEGKEPQIPYVLGNPHPTGARDLEADCRRIQEQRDCRGSLYQR